MITSTFRLHAETIAMSLDKAKRHSKDKFIACCPAHDDNNPSLAISDINGKTLLHCFAGCSQNSVIKALRDKGLWSQEKHHRKQGYLSKGDFLEMLYFVQICKNTERILTNKESIKLKACIHALQSKGFVT
jgi:hypothetical protein